MGDLLLRIRALVMEWPSWPPLASAWSAQFFWDDDEGGACTTHSENCAGLRERFHVCQNTQNPKPGLNLKPETLKKNAAETPSLQP